jgi:uncharacterized RDD family membrane protein YckC
VEATGPTRTPYASWGRRFVAYLADAVILIAFPIGAIIAGARSVVVRT